MEKVEQPASTAEVVVEAPTPALDPANPPEGMSPADTAANMYYLMKPRFDLMMSHLSGRGVKRVVDRILQYPLEKNFSWSDMKEKETYLLGCSLQDCMFSMMMASYFENLPELLASAGAAAEEPTPVPTTTEGASNG